MDKSYVATVTSAQCSYNLQVRAVTRKFVSQDRAVFAWISIGVVANKGVRFQGEGMMVLERSPLAPTQSALLKTWHRMRVEQVESHFGSANEIGMLKVVGMKALSLNVAGCFAALENTLLQAAVDKPIVFSSRPAFPGKLYDDSSSNEHKGVGRRVKQVLKPP